MKKIITQEKQPIIKPNLQITTELHRKTLWIDFVLWSKINNYLQGQRIQSDFTYPSFSAFVRAALTLYQQQELKVSYYRLNKRKQVGIKWNEEINNFYLALPIRKRTEIINGLLNALLNKASK